MNIIAILSISLAVLFVMQTTQYLLVPYSALILRESSKYMIPSSLALGQVAIESNFNPSAVSNKGAIGLMQITAPALYDVNNELKTSFTLADMYEPEKNIKVGMAFLDMKRKQYNSLYAAYVAYYAGHYPNAEGKIYADSVYQKSKEF